MRNRWLGVAVLVVLCGVLSAAEKPVGVVSHVKVLSDKVADVSSLEAWKRSFIHDGMTDEQKALAIWKSTVMFRYQDPPPFEFLTRAASTTRSRPSTSTVTGCAAAPPRTSRPWPATWGWRPAAGRSTATACRRSITTTPGTCSTPRWSTTSPRPDGKIASMAEMVAAVKGWLDQASRVEAERRQAAAVSPGAGLDWAGSKGRHC